MIIYRQHYFAFFTLLEHTELALSLQEKARRKAGLRFCGAENEFAAALPRRVARASHSHWM